jgi:hypothetical protein
MKKLIAASSALWHRIQMKRLAALLALLICAQRKIARLPDSSKNAFCGLSMSSY